MAGRATPKLSIIRRRISSSSIPVSPTLQDQQRTSQVLFQIVTTTEQTTMQTKMKFTTLSYKYDDNDEEFIFCMKGKPFPCLVSDKLPKSTRTLIDYSLVRELGLKMSDLQCKKFTYAGHKMRILGTLSITIQCITDGTMFGSTRLQADVVQDLNKNLEVDCLAGQKMAAQLRGNNYCTPSGALSPRATPATKPRTPSPPPPKSSPKPHTPSPPTTPPRHSRRVFPSTPPDNSPIYVEFGSPCPPSPHTANIEKLEDMFGEADLHPTSNAEIHALFAHDDTGEIDVNPRGIATFHRVRGDYSGAFYRTGHGRYKCNRVQCARSSDVPYNCGFNTKLWQYPPGFRVCGDNCFGAFCRCLHDYDD